MISSMRNNLNFVKIEAIYIDLSWLDIKSDYFF